MNQFAELNLEREIEEKTEKAKRELLNFIADKFKDLQLRSTRLRHPEDKEICLVELKKMNDDIEDCIRAYIETERLQVR